jgi:HSP20 family protein
MKMAKLDEKALQAPKQEVVTEEEMERTRSRRCFLPRTDILESEDAILIAADIPGVSKDAVDITLDKNVLTIEAFTEPQVPSGFDLTYAEYEPGDYRRSFRLSSEIDRDKIEAAVSNGELRLRLPKAEAAKIKKIPVKAA